MIDTKVQLDKKVIKLGRPSPINQLFKKQTPANRHQINLRKSPVPKQKLQPRVLQMSQTKNSKHKKQDSVHESPFKDISNVKDDKSFDNQSVSQIKHITDK